MAVLTAVRDLELDLQIILNKGAVMVLPSNINKATGRPVPIVTHPYMPQGTLFALSLELPFPVADLANPVEFEARQEYLQLDYPVSQPTRNFDVIVDGVLKVYYTTGCGVIRNIAASA